METETEHKTDSETKRMKEVFVAKTRRGIIIKTDGQTNHDLGHQRSVCLPVTNITEMTKSIQINVQLEI